MGGETFDRHKNTSTLPSDRRREWPEHNGTPTARQYNLRPAKYLDVTSYFVSLEFNRIVWKVPTLLNIKQYCLLEA
jgi:hypothetical protein